MKKHHTPKSLRITATAVLLSVWPVTSYGAISGSFVINGNGTVTYSYTVDNTAGAFDIAGWTLEFPFAQPDWNPLDAPAGDVTVPNQHWVAGAGTPVTGLSAQDFLSLDSEGDVLTGSSLAGFSFTSAFLPGPVSYHEFSAVGDSENGDTIGPAVAPVDAVPDSGSHAIEVTALSLAVIGASRMHNAKVGAR